MLKNINIDKLIESNVVANLTGDLAIFTVDPIGEYDSEMLTEPEMDYIELIIDKDLNPIFIDEKYIIGNRINAYKEILKDAAFYLLAKKEYNNIYYTIYDIIRITDNIGYKNAYQKAAVINLSNYAMSFNNNIDIDRLKRKFKEDVANTINAYIKVMKLAMDVMEYGKEYVSKDLYKLYYSRESSFIGAIKYVKDGKMPLNDIGGIPLSNDGCILSDIVIFDDDLISMVNLNDLLLSVSINPNNEDGFILTYNDGEEPHTPVFKMSIKDTISLERNVAVKNSLLKFVEAVKGDK